MCENLGELVTTLQSDFWTSCNLLSSKSVSDDANRVNAIVHSAAHQSIC